MKLRSLAAAVLALGMPIALLHCTRAGGERASGAAAATRAAALSDSRRTAIVTAAQRVSPAVVSVSVTGTRVVRGSPFGGMFNDPFFNQMLPQYEYHEQISGLGSGFIVDRSGVLLTNEHVLRDADSVRVTLPDGRVFRARILATSREYDLGVLKIAGADLPVAPLGSSDGLVVGEWAIAIGNPFGYLLLDTQPTVTAGVISATHRDVRAEATESGVYKNMIQTDAAINPGNSGGPLVNADGEVVGINTFIFTPTGGSIGLGFAIPINVARQKLAEVQRYGRIRVAWPGLSLQPVTPELAARLGWQSSGGFVVTRVEHGGPAEQAGVRAGDRLLAVNGIAINSVDDVQRGIYGASVGDRLALRLERTGRRFEVTLVLAELPRSTD
jgi:serine protease Do